MCKHDCGVALYPPPEVGGFTATEDKLLGLLSKGQWFGLLLSLGLVVLAGFAIYWHEPWVAGVAVMAIVGILIVYVLRQQPKQQNLPPQ